ncbi:MAG: CYTH domain-containing protein [Deltaproteobacteria bacterium]|nr:CYTH domain-containing protein [Deltaproteobacteria bacterium]
MHTEIERKFLLLNDAWRREVTQTLVLRQGYLATDPGCTVRVRVSGPSAWLTIKGRNVDGSAPEFEYPIPASDAAAMLELLARKPLIEKKRHLVPRDGFTWEVDEFLGPNAGLLVAEIELESLDQPFPRPSWIGREVTGERQYYNASLVARPFSDW